MTYNLVENYYGGGGGGECDFTATAGGTNYYFGGKLIKNPSGYVYPDRLGSVGKFYPYGIERPSATTNGKEKFTGYFRDADTGNDYALNRYMTPGMGRFITPDPSKGSHADPANPGSWNLYAYTHGDPINSSDPTGLCPLESGGDGDDSSCGDSGVTAQECEMYNIDPDPNFCEAIISAGIGESSGGGGDGSAPSAPASILTVPGTTITVTETADPVETDPSTPPVTTSSQNTTTPSASSAGGSSSPLYCNDDVIRAMKAAWSLSGNGMRTEAGFAVSRTTAASIVVGPVVNPNQAGAGGYAGQMTMNLPSGTYAQFHVHPKAAKDPWPDGIDPALAARGVDVYTMSLQGLYVMLAHAAAPNTTPLRSFDAFLHKCK